MNQFVDDSLSVASDEESCGRENDAIIEPKALRSFLSQNDLANISISNPSASSATPTVVQQEEEEESVKCEKVSPVEEEEELMEIENAHGEEEEDADMFSNIAPATIHQIETNAFFKPRKQATWNSTANSLASMNEREWESFRPARIQGPEHINRWSEVEDDLPETLRWKGVDNENETRRTAVSLRDEYGSRSRVLANSNSVHTPNTYNTYTAALAGGDGNSTAPQLGVRQRLRSIGRLFSKEVDYSNNINTYGEHERPWDSRIHEVLRRADSSYATEGMEPSRIEIIAAINSVTDEEKERAGRIKALLKGKRGTTRRRKPLAHNNIPKWPNQLRKVKTGLNPEWWA